MNWNPFSWNENQLASAGRNVVSAVGGIVGTLVAMHFLSSQQSSDITSNIDLIVHGVTQTVTGIIGLAGVLGPIWAALRAAHNASPSQVINHAAIDLSASQSRQASDALADPSARNKIINAVAEMPEVRAIVTPEAVAHATDSAKVVSTPAEAAQLPLAITPSATFPKRS